MRNEKLKKDSHSPPFIAELLLKFFFPDNGKYTTIGDLHESYNYISVTEGSFKAKWL